MESLKMKEEATSVVQKLQDNKFLALFAGGCVRDRLLGLEPKDYDIATNATPDEIEALFPKTIPVGKAFGVIVVLQAGFEFEVATFRGDGESSDGRRPDEVTFHTRHSYDSIEADVMRRDLTINGMMYDPIEDKLHDYVGGEKDLDNGYIRFIGKASQRIQEDKLRMLRAIRFKFRLGFRMTHDVKDALKENAHLITSVSKERIREEMCKMLPIEPASTLRMMNRLGLLEHILPEVTAMIDCQQPAQYHPEGDVFIHTMLALDYLPTDVSLEVIWATLLHDVGKPPTQTFEDRIRFNGHDQESEKMSEVILKRLKFPTKFIQHVLPLVGCHMRWMAVQDMKKSKLKKFMAMDNFEDHIALHRVDCLSSHGSTENIDYVNSMEFTPEEIKPPRLIGGKELIALGVEPGKGMGVILDKVMDHQLEGNLKTPEEAIDFVKGYLDGKKWKVV